MNQLSIFNNYDKVNSDKKENSVFELYIDGASRNNPGLSGAGVYIKKNNKELIKSGYYLGIKTCNQAEYLALLLGLLLIKKYIKDQDRLEIRSDSLLLVKQILGEYKITNPVLKKLNNYIKNSLNDLNYDIYHILRDKNKIADKLANQAIDQKLNIEYNIKEEIKEKLDIDI